MVVALQPAGVQPVPVTQPGEPRVLLAVRRPAQAARPLEAVLHPGTAWPAVVAWPEPAAQPGVRPQAQPDVPAQLPVELAALLVLLLAVVAVPGGLPEASPELRQAAAEPDAPRAEQKEPSARGPPGALAGRQDAAAELRVQQVEAAARLDAAEVLHGRPAEAAVLRDAVGAVRRQEQQDVPPVADHPAHVHPVADRDARRPHRRRADHLLHPADVADGPRRHPDHRRRVDRAAARRPGPRPAPAAPASSGSARRMASAPMP